MNTTTENTDTPRRADGMPASAEERRLRRILCASRHGTVAYMDDGEASFCGDDVCRPIDYMRESLDQIEQTWTTRNLLVFSKLTESVDEIERAFQMLEINGVPRSIAKTIANGIEVLVQRMNKEINSVKEIKSEWRKVALNFDGQRMIFRYHLKQITDIVIAWGNAHVPSSLTASLKDAQVALASAPEPKIVITQEDAIMVLNATYSELNRDTMTKALQDLIDHKLKQANPT